MSDALARLTDTLNERNLLQPLAGEMIQVEDSLGRVTADAVFAVKSSPHYHCAAMDGYSLDFA
ncbi:MAG: hypothetical protein ACYCXJ_08550, partial [Thermoleophilia bacterium]